MATTADYRWIFVDADSNGYNLSNKSAKVIDDALAIEVELLDRSFKAGAIFPGVQRDETKDFAIQINVDYPTEAAFDTYVNTLLQKARNSILLQDDVMKREVESVLRDWSITYDEGGFKLGALITLTFAMLKPYWQDIDFTIESSTGTAGEIILTNNGYIEAPPIITLIASEAVSKFLLYISETRKGILIQDLQFGLAGNNTYIIDCDNGTAELNAVPREDTIKDGTGFFNIPVGTSTLIIESSGTIAISVQFKKRYYI